MIQPSQVPPDGAAWIEGLLPGPEPVLAPGPHGFIPVSGPRLDGNELAYLRECLESGWVSSAGPLVGRFEEAFAAAAGCQFGVACANGTVALHLVLSALGIGPGDEVVVPAFTMIATVNAVRYTGATPVLVDAEPQTYNLDVTRVERLLTPRTRAILAVHLYGHPADMDALRALADRHGLYLLEDAAEAHGAQYRGRAAGSLGDAATFSFYANKIITTGEGGMVTTNDPALARLARRLRDHAFSDERHFWHQYVGFNYRMSSLQAAVGLAQTERLGELVAHRRRNARRYTQRLEGLPGLVLPGERPEVRNAYWVYAALVGEAFGCSRDELRRRLAACGVETRSFFIPVHLQPIYYDRFRGQRFPVAEDLCRRGLYLPSGASLSEADIDYVAGAVARVHQEVASPRRRAA